MNQLLNKLEKKFGRYAVPDLIKYVIVLYCAGAALGLINENIYYSYLSLNVEAVLHGQIWRLFTYLIEPYGFNGLYCEYPVLCDSGQSVLPVWKIAGAGMGNLPV